MKSSQAALGVVLVLTFSLTGCVERGPLSEPAISFAHSEHPPFTLEVTAVARGGELELTARVDLHAPLPVPLELIVALSDGETLVAGRPHERIARPTRGNAMVRTFRVAGAGQGPLTITATQQAGDVMGATATRTWPPPPPEVFDATWAPVAPTAHGEVVVREAIVVSGAGR